MDEDLKRLTKAGWVRSVIDGRTWLADPATGKRYRLSHAIIVLDEYENQEQIKHNRIRVEEEIASAEFYKDFYAYDHDIDEIFPKVTKKHGKLEYCDHPYGCVYHDQLVKCGDHFHHRKRSDKPTTCPGVKEINERERVTTSAAVPAANVRDVGRADEPTKAKAKGSHRAIPANRKAGKVASKPVSRKTKKAKE